MMKINTKTLISLFILFIVSVSAKANNVDSTQPENKNLTGSSTPEKQDSANAVAASKIPMVTDVFKEGSSNKNKSDINRNSAGIGDIIVIRVANLKPLLEKSKCRKVDGKDSTPCNQQAIRLFINGRIITDITPLSGAPEVDSLTGDGELQYRLERNEHNTNAWTDLLGAPKINKQFFTRPVRVSVGLEDEYPIKISNDAKKKIDGGNFYLIRVRNPWFWWCLAGIAGYIILIILMARKTDLLRDRSIKVDAIFSDPADQVKYNYNPLQKIVRPYSLGRVQMAFWFTLVITSFLFIWLINGATDIITSSILALIGISAGTSLSGFVIDNSKNTERLNATLLLKNEKINLDKDISDLATQIQTAAAGVDISALEAQKNVKESRLAVINPDIDQNMRSLKPKASDGFINDLLSDADGISFHRLQMFVWTLVLGLLFIYSVWARLSMPEFSATLLALQGLTAGTYLGFKIPEKQP